MRHVLLLLLLFAGVPLESAAPVRSADLPVPLPLFPQNNWWNTDISGAPVDSQSSSFIEFIGASRGLHPDFGGDAGGGDVYGFPVIVVDSSQAKRAVTFQYADESDGVDHATGRALPFYPIPEEAISQSGWIEGGQPGSVDQRSDADRHILIVDRSNNDIYELYNMWFEGTRWVGGSGAFFDLERNDRRPEGWTSADAAGLAILPGLVRHDEVFGASEILHAFRVTVRATNGFVYPASHRAGSNPGALPMGARLRLKAGKDISGHRPEIQKIFRAMKRYGLIVADNGSDMYVSGSYDTRWNNDVLNPAFRSLKASDFEVIERGWRPAHSFLITIQRTLSTGEPVTLTLTVVDRNGSVASGFRGTVTFTTSDGAGALPMAYTFVESDRGVHGFDRAVTLRSPGVQLITVRDAAAPSSTGSISVTVSSAARPPARRRSIRR